MARQFDEARIEAVGDDGNPGIGVTALQASGSLDDSAGQIAAIDDEQRWDCALIAGENGAFVGCRAGNGKTGAVQEVLETDADQRVPAHENSLESGGIILYYTYIAIMCTGDVLICF
jgi:hypothetical protein